MIIEGGRKGTSDLFCKLGKYHNHVEEITQGCRSTRKQAAALAVRAFKACASVAVRAMSGGRS